VRQGNFPPTQLTTILEHHIHSVLTHYAGRVCAWDVVNEAFNSDGTMRRTIWYDQPGISGSAGAGTSYIEQALKWARQADPNAKSFYNDYDAEEINQKSDAIYAMAADFKKRGVPLDGIGFQTHISLKFDNPAKLESFARTSSDLPSWTTSSRSPNSISGSAIPLQNRWRRKPSSTGKSPSFVCSNPLASSSRPGESATSTHGSRSFTNDKAGRYCGTRTTRGSRRISRCETRWPSRNARF